MFRLSQEGEDFVKNELERYEDRRSAILPALFRAQKENDGWISSECISYLSKLMDMPERLIEEVFSFYTMYNKKPVGKYHVQVCTNVSCAMNGGRELFNYLCKTYDATPEEMTADARFTFSRVECLGSCGTAPMMQVNDEYHENLTPDSAAALLNGMK